MRNSFMGRLAEVAMVDSRVQLVVADVGYSVVEEIQKNRPNQFLNVGVAEQNMVGVAAGMALKSDNIVFTYSISNFATTRCLEQIRNDICYHNLNVKIVSVGAGVSYGPQGYTHFGLEDLAFMQALPNLKIVCPADPFEARAAADLALSEVGPLYVRLARTGEPKIHSREITKEALSRPILVREGSGQAVFAVGPVIGLALEAWNILRKTSFEPAIYSLPMLDESNIDGIIDVIRKVDRVLVIEDHGPVGGYGSRLRDLLQDRGETVPVKKMCLRDLVHDSGSEAYLRRKGSLSVEEIVRSCSS